MEHPEHPAVDAPAVQPPSLTPAMISSAAAMGPWLRFFSILAFVGVGLMLVAGGLMLVLGVVGGAFADEMGGGLMLIALAAIYVVMAAVYVVPGVYLFRCANGAGSIRRGDPVTGLEQLLEYHRAFWKFLGVVTIVLLCLYPVLVVVAIVVPILAGSM